MNRIELHPQPGFQQAFLSSAADIVIGGGAAGAGKSYALLMEVLRHSGNRGFRAVVFRRTTTQIKNLGGLWDTSKELYLKLMDDRGQKPTSTEQPPKWVFPSGAQLLFSHLEHEADKYSWDGSQVALIGFDELIHFTESQFWYMVSRNRSTCGVKPYMRATTNPQKSGWVKRFLAWWLYPDDHDDEDLRGMPIPERAGVIRYLARYAETCYWGDSPDEVIGKLPADIQDSYSAEFLKTVTFIPGTLSENKVLVTKDPGYKGNLLAQDRAHGSRLLRGCWYEPDDGDVLFRNRDLVWMLANRVEGDQTWYLTADIAMDGCDLFRVAIWYGWHCVRIESYPKADGEFIWRKLAALAAEYGIEGRHIAFDAQGVGNFLTGFFTSSVDFRTQQPPIQIGDVKVSFQNLRTQCAYRISERVLRRQITVSVPSSEHDMLIEEFEAHRKKGENLAGKLCITRKEDAKAALKRSPDYFDVLLMRAFWDLAASQKSYLAYKDSELIIFDDF